LGREIILALVVEKPGTAFELENRLRRRFPSYGYARNIVRRTLGRLRTSGLVSQRPPAGQAGATGREGMVWEATSAGAERSRAWVGEELGGPLARDELHARIALCGPQDLPRLLEVVRNAERTCEERLAALGPQADRAVLAADAGGWAAEMESIAGDAERASLANRASWLSGVKLRLRAAEEQTKPPRSGPDT
jgi:hypothetical protein